MPENDDFSNSVVIRKRVQTLPVPSNFQTRPGIGNITKVTRISLKIGTSLCTRMSARRGLPQAVFCRGIGAEHLDHMLSQIDHGSAGGSANKLLTLGQAQFCGLQDER